MNLFFKSWLAVFLFWLLILGGWIIGVMNSLHFKYWWFDIGMHFLGGVWVFMVALKLKNQYKIEISAQNKFITSFIIFVSVVVFVGVLWEFFEFVFDRFILKTGFTHMRRVYEDTLSDLCMDIVGGAVGALVYLLSNDKTNA